MTRSILLHQAVVEAARAYMAAHLQAERAVGLGWAKEHERVVLRDDALQELRDTLAAAGRGRGELARLAEVERSARSLMSRDDFWRNAGTLPGEYDNLRDALKEVDGE